MSVFAVTVIRLRRIYPTISRSFFHRPNPRSPVERPCRRHCRPPAPATFWTAAIEPGGMRIRGWARRRFKSTRPSPREWREGTFRWGAAPLRGHLAHEVALADLDA